MEKSAKQAPSSSPIVRLLKTKFLNILVAVVLIICLILFMRGGDADERIRVEEGGAPQSSVVQNQGDTGQDGEFVYMISSSNIFKHYTLISKTHLGKSGVLRLKP